MMVEGLYCVCIRVGREHHISGVEKNLRLNDDAGLSCVYFDTSCPAWCCPGLLTLTTLTTDTRTDLRVIIQLRMKHGHL